MFQLQSKKQVYTGPSQSNNKSLVRFIILLIKFSLWKLEIVFSDTLFSHQHVTCYFKGNSITIYDSTYRIKYKPLCNFQFCAHYLSDFLLLLFTDFSDAQFFTFSYVMPPAAIISFPWRPQDYIILSSTLSCLRETFSSVFTVKKRICWTAHEVPDVTKSVSPDPWCEVQQSVNRFYWIVSLKRNRGFKTSFIGRNSRQVGNSQRFFVRVFGVSWPIEFCICITLSKLLWFSLQFMYNLHCLQPRLKMRTNLWGVKSSKKAIWSQRQTGEEWLGTGPAQVKPALSPNNHAKEMGTLETVSLKPFLKKGQDYRCHVIRTPSQN